jgi:hypothetical protein
VLEAIVQRGVDCVEHKTPQPDDAENIQIAADAARQIVSRKGQVGITPDLIDRAAWEIGIFEEQIGHTPQLSAAEQFQNKLDAIEAYVGYCENYGVNKERVDDALDNALSLLTKLRAENANDDKVNALYDRALKVALFKVGRRQIAWAVAARKRELQDFSSAAEAYGMVKTDDPIANVRAKYFQLFCYQQLLSRAPEAEKPPLLVKIQKLADELKPMIDAAAPAAAADAKLKLQLDWVRARTALLAADVARASKDPARVVDQLKNFEQLIAAFPEKDQNDLLGSALFLRVNALMALNRTDEAIQEVQKLIARQTPETALGTVSTLVEKINEAYRTERGKAESDRNTLLLLATQRATLSDMLITIADKDPKTPDANKREYRRFQIGSLRTAAELEPDAVKKKAYLEKALAGYQELAKGMDAKSPAFATNQRDIALTQFELGGPDNLQKAHDTLDQLFAEKKFGDAMTRVGDESKMNDTYWEGLLRLLQAKVALSDLKHDPALREEAQRIMKLHVIIPFGDNAGGSYAKDFKALRKQLLGDWKPQDEAAKAGAVGPSAGSAATPRSASQPASRP